MIYDLNYGNGSYCLAYSSATGRVYLHPSCPVAGAPSCQQWKFISLGSRLYLLENGYEINGGYYCMEYERYVAPMGSCSAGGRKMEHRGSCHAPLISMPNLR